MATASGDSIQISSPEELRDWLSDKPPEWAHVIAMRMALRVLPLITAVPRGGEPDDDLALLPRIGVAVLAWTGAAYPDLLTELAPKAAELASEADPTTDKTPDRIAYSAAMAVSTACVALYPLSKPEDSHKSVHERAVETATFAHSAYYEAVGSEMGGFWSALSNDSAAFDVDQQVPKLASLPLWGDAVVADRMRSAYSQFVSVLNARSENWSVWVRWINARMAGKPSFELDPGVAETFDRRIAEQPAGWWMLDPSEVNSVVKQWVEEGRGSGATTTTTRREADTPNSFIHDDVDGTVDYLGRSRLAFILAGRINQIWDDLVSEENSGTVLPEDSEDPKPGFVVHVDAPWGGGKTSFVRYLSRILNPYRHPGPPPEWLRKLPMADADFWPESYRRPWRIVWFNAWQREHVKPPWWVFYETVRQQIARATGGEWARVTPKPPLDDDGAEMPDADLIPQPVAKGHRYANWVGRRAGVLEGWLTEGLWRLWTPALRNAAISFGLVVFALVVLQALGWLSLSNTAEDGVSVSLLGLPGLITIPVLVLIGGAPILSGLFETFTKSLLPGTPDAAENYSLGAGDPLDHFRRHFARKMKQVRRPILVVVDDLDRCRPDYVVDLIRGMQTILQSERVIFILLGDRDWIEHSFAGSFKEMNEIDVGPEHSFGGRFVEKAIQLSLMLPDIDPEVRRDYVNALIDIEHPEEDDDAQAVRAEGIDLDALTASFVAQSKAALRIDDIRERDTQIAAARAPLEAYKTDPKVAAVIRQVSTQRALRSAGDKNLDKVTKVRLAGLAGYLPANPRQIKRIINAISLWQQVALMEADMEPGGDQWQKLVRWIVIMTEWPQSWFTLSHYPDLVTLVYTPQADKTGLELPDKPDELAAQIRACDPVYNLLDLTDPGADWSRGRIEKDDIDLFKHLVPPTSGSFLTPAGGGDAGDAKQDQDGQTGHKGES